MSPSRSTEVGSPTMQQSSARRAALQRLDDAHRAVDRRAFLVAGDQQRDRARRARMRRARTPRSPPPSRRSRSSCRPRRGRRAGRRGASARRGRCATARAGRWARRRCGRRTPAVGPGRAPRRMAHRLLTRAPSGPNGIGSQTKPSGCRRSAISAWQPPSSGVTEGRAISASSRCSVSSMRELSMQPRKIDAVKRQRATSRWPVAP